VRYIIDKGIKGDFVECGVFFGGASTLIAKTRLSLGIHAAGPPSAGEFHEPSLREAVEDWPGGFEPPIRNAP
jgi:hypothetical protein